MAIYHFKGKDDILETLVANFLDEYRQLLQTAKDGTHNEGADQMIDRLQSRYAGFAMDNLEVVRIMFVESLKKTNGTPPIFKVAEEIVNAGGGRESDTDKRFVAEFFSGVIPLFAYLCFHGQWCGYFKIDKQEFDKLFLAHIAESHGSYHKNREEND